MGNAPRARGLALPFMAALLVAYAVLHTPARGLVARVLGTSAQGCYLCAGGVAPDGAAPAAAAGALILAALAAGWVIAAGGVPGHWRSYERPVVFGLAAFGLASVPAALVAGIGSASGTALLRAPRGPLLALLPSLGILLAAAARGSTHARRATPRRPPRTPGTLRRPAPPLALLVLALGAGLLFGEAIVSLSHPATQGDAMSYHGPLALFLWRDGNMTTFLARAPALFAMAHPGLTELWLGALRLLGGERLADLGQLPFALLAAAAVAAFARRLGAGPGAARLAGGAVLLSPLLVGQAGVPANDLATSALVIATAALAAAPQTEWSRGRVVAVGAGIGLVTASKLALAPEAAVLAAVAVRVVTRRPAERLAPASWRSGWGRAAALAVPFALVVAPWWIRDAIRYHNPIYPARIPIYGHGVDVAGLGAIDSQFVPTRLAWPLYPLAEPHDDRSGFGTLLAVAALPGLIVLLCRARRVRRLRRPLGILGLLVVVGLPAWWVGTLHEPRFLFPLAALAMAAIPFAPAAVPRRRRHAAGVLLAVAAIFSAVVTTDQVLLPYARLPSARATFYDRVWAVDPYVESLPSRVGLLWQTGFGTGESDYAAYYPLLGPALRRRVINVDIEPGDGRSPARDTERIVARMRAEHLEYAYVQAVPALRTQLEARYPPTLFRLVHLSAFVPDGRLGGRRHLLRDVSPDTPGAVRRYLFKLRASR